MTSLENSLVWVIWRVIQATTRPKKSLLYL